MIIAIIFKHNGCSKMANVFFKIDITVFQLSHDISFLVYT